MAPPAKSVLWVDDEAELLESHRIFLRYKGYEVETATNADDAVELLRRRAVDLMLLDVDLPYIDGHSLLQAVHDNGLDIPAIFISGLPGEEVELKAFQVGATDFIRKPVKNNVLLARVSKALKLER